MHIRFDMIQTGFWKLTVLISSIYMYDQFIHTQYRKATLHCVILVNIFTNITMHYVYSRKSDSDIFSKTQTIYILSARLRQASNNVTVVIYKYYYACFIHLS